MKKPKLKLFSKTFVYTFCLMMVIVIISHLMIFILLPKVYNFQQKNELEADVSKLYDNIAATPDADRLFLVTDFAGRWNADVLVKYKGYIYEMNILNANENHSSEKDKQDNTIITEKTGGKIKISLEKNPKSDTDFFYVEKAFPDQNGYLKATVSRQQIEDAVSVVIVLLPITAFVCTLISILFSLLYSHMLTKPIKQISNTTKQMQELTYGACCEIHTHDEIETLADNVNALYDNLLRTIRDLEQEIHKVEEMELQRTDFLRSASHELKTPVTAVNVMLENMILNVGKYKDHSVYLPKCKMLIEQLAIMIKDIVESSRADKITKEDETEFDLPKLVQSAIEPYQIIAKSKDIRLEIDLLGTFTVCYPLSMIRKVISNILSNAVSYTPKGGKIKVYLDGRRLIFENECVPISQENLTHIFDPFYRLEYGRDRNTGGSGLGLYIVATFLKAMQIPYSFIPSAEGTGMYFSIDF